MSRSVREPGLPKAKGTLEPSLPEAALEQSSGGSLEHRLEDGLESQQAAQPLNVNGALHNGLLYYPYRLKRVVIEDGVELTRYETLVLRSDGVSLGFGYKAAPRGTPSEDRVLALDDGTELSRPPQAAPGQSFSLAGITRFVAARERGQSALGASPAKLFSQLEQHLKRAATLPFEEDYTLLALCVLTSYC